MLQFIFCFNSSLYVWVSIFHAYHLFLIFYQIWITDRAALIRMVVSRGCSRPAGVPRRLAAASGALLVPARRLHLVHADRLYDDW